MSDPEIPKIPADAEARARILGEHGTTLIVEAAAGTGKTTALVGRLVAMIRSGACVLPGVVAVTFTDKAAGELTLRLRAALEDALERTTLEEEARRCEAALEHLETARVGTIHGFCTDLLRERPVEAGVDPAFVQIADDEAEALLDRAVAEVLEKALASPPEGIRRLLRRPAKDDQTARERLKGAARVLADHRDHRAPWRRDPFDRDVEIDAMMLELQELRAIHAQSDDPSDYLAQGIEPLARFAAETEAREQVAPRDHDGLEAALAGLLAPYRVRWNWKGGKKHFGPNLPRAGVIAKRDGFKLKLDGFVARADADLAACLKRDLEPIVVRYEELKTRLGVLDFLDLLLEVRRMLVEQPAVRRELQARLTHLFVDEFQDTDPVQADIVMLLASDDPEVSDPASVRPAPGKLFVVGDPKQSIYRFRRADMGAYERIKAQLVRGGAALVHLTTSFRSQPAIQKVVNAAFGPAMEGGAGAAHADYVPLTEWRENETRRPSVIALGIPRPYGFRDSTSKPAKYAIEESTPDAVAAFVAWLVNESGWKVLDPARGEDVPVAPRHVCLLFRRKQGYGGMDVIRPYLRGLEARRVPHVWVGGRSFHDREEIVALRALAAAIEHPDDALSVYAALRGPFLALTDADLLLFRDRVGSLHPMRRIEAASIEPALRPIADALALLRELHLGRNRAPIADTFARFFDATRAHASLALAFGGEQVLASALRILDVARRFDQRGALSYRGFVELLEGQAERGEAADEASGEEGQEGVRVMTVHKAKGLEFPVVVLCDPTAGTGAFADRFVDASRGEFFAPLAGIRPAEMIEREETIIRANEAETVRLTYVAATRARDLLVIPACGDGPIEGSWLSVLDRAIYPAREAWRQGDGRAPGCPQFGDDSVLERPTPLLTMVDTSVRPGLHRQLGVVWWDPQLLKLDVDAPDGLRSEEILRGVPGVDDGSRAHRAWVDGKAMAIEDGALPTIPATSVRELARKPRVSGSEPEIERLGSAQAGRAGGRRTEALFRSVLALVEAGDPEDVTRGLVRARARAIGADPEEESAVGDALCAVLRHPWVASSKAADRAVPIASQDDRGGVVEGSIDLVRDEGDGLVAVRIAFSEGEPTEAQRAEAAIAADALAEISGRKVRAVLLLV